MLEVVWWLVGWLVVWLFGRFSAMRGGERGAEQASLTGLPCIVDKRVTKTLEKKKKGNEEPLKKRFRLRPYRQSSQNHSTTVESCNCTFSLQYS